VLGIQDCLQNTPHGVASQSNSDTGQAEAPKRSLQDVPEGAATVGCFAAQADGGLSGQAAHDDVDEAMRCVPCPTERHEPPALSLSSATRSLLCSIDRSTHGLSAVREGDAIHTPDRRTTYASRGIMVWCQASSIESKSSYPEKSGCPRVWCC